MSARAAGSGGAPSSGSARRLQQLTSSLVPAAAAPAAKEGAKKIAFVGFRHGHIGAVYQACLQSDAFVITGVCEEDAATREELGETYASTHTSYARMLAEVEADIIAVGDYFTIRGARIIAALEAGKHVIGDKPLCTSLDELDTIEALSAERGLAVFCQLDMRDSPVFQLARQRIQNGDIGELVTVSFGGQHALNYNESAGGRAAWYFEEGKHGGTLSDIAVHGVDLVQLVSGSRVKRVVGARCWSTGRAPHIEDAAQVRQPAFRLALKL
eukprot:SAG22_NODE_5137_length_1079_cov_1.261224_1_plen_270_part_00